MDEDNNTRALRNSFYLGLYNNVIEEAKGSSSNADKVFYYRALLETNPKQVFSEVDASSPTAHQAVKMLGTLREAEADNKDMVFETVNEWLGDEILKEDHTLQLIASQMFLEEEHYKEALMHVSNAGEDLEKLAMQVQIFLRLDRYDLASKIVKAMADVDDDDPLTQLATAWLYVCQGDDKVTEASFLFQELVDKFGPSIPVLASLAVCQIHLGNCGEAFAHLKQARQMAMQADQKASTETLVNSIVCMYHLRKPEVVPKVTRELEGNDCRSAKAWVQHNATMEAMFDKHAKEYSLTS